MNEVACEHCGSGDVKAIEIPDAVADIEGVWVEPND
jgi:hypothetical protein